MLIHTSLVRETIAGIGEFDESDRYNLDYTRTLQSTQILRRLMSALYCDSASICSHVKLAYVVPITVVPRSTMHVALINTDFTAAPDRIPITTTVIS